MSTKSEEQIYNNAYLQGDDLWHKVSKKVIHKTIFKDIENMLDKIRKAHARGKVLNLGCGTGKNIKKLCKYGKEVINIDISPYALKQAKLVCKNQNAVFILGDCNKIDYPQNSFNYIEGVAILHHVEHKKVLQKVFDILKPGGVAVFLEPGLLNPPAIFARRLMRSSFHTPNEHPFIPSLIARTASSFGFECKLYCFNIVSYGLSYKLPDLPIFRILLRGIRIIERKVEQNILKNFCGNFLITLKKPESCS